MKKYVIAASLLLAGLSCYTPEPYPEIKAEIQRTQAGEFTVVEVDTTETTFRQMRQTEIEVATQTASVLINGIKSLDNYALSLQESYRLGLNVRPELDSINQLIKERTAGVKQWVAKIDSLETSPVTEGPYQTHYEATIKTSAGQFKNYRLTADTTGAIVTVKQID